MPENTVEARIRNYSNEELTGIRDRLHRQMFKVGLESVNRMDLRSTLRLLMGLFKPAGEQGVVEEQPSQEDLASFIRTQRDLRRMDIMGLLGGKLYLEQERRRVYGL